MCEASCVKLNIISSRSVKASQGRVGGSTSIQLRPGDRLVPVPRWASVLYMQYHIQRGESLYNILVLTLEATRYLLRSSWTHFMS